MSENKEVLIEKVIDRPLQKVWESWTNPEVLKQWWGPHGVTIPECSLDLQVGGKFYIVMLAGEEMGPFKGTRWPMEARFTIIEPRSRLAYTARAWTEGQESETTIEQTTDILFSEIDGKTKITVKAVITKAGSGAQMAVQGMEHGFNQQLEKLQTFLEKNL